MFTRSHYRAIAEVIAGGVETVVDYESRSASNPEYDRGYRDSIEAIAVDLCYVFEKDNPNFNRNAFMDACNVERTAI